MSAFYYFIQSWQYLFNPAYRKYILLSAVISILSFLALSWGLEGLTSVIADLLTEWIPWSWSGAQTLYSWFVRLLAFLLLINIFKYIVLILLGPVMSLLSEKVEYTISPEKKGRKIPGFVRGSIRALRVNISNLFKEWLWTILLLVVSFFPGAAIFTAPAIFMVQLYFAGFGLMDFYLERYADVRQSRLLVWRYKWFAISIGFIFITFFAIPVVGMILAPVTGVIAATLFFEKEVILE